MIAGLKQKAAYLVEEVREALRNDLLRRSVYLVCALVGALLAGLILAKSVLRFPGGRESGVNTITMPVVEGMVPGSDAYMGSPRTGASEQDRVDADRIITEMRKQMWELELDVENRQDRLNYLKDLLGIPIDEKDMHYDAFAKKMNEYARNIGQVAVKMRQRQVPRHREKEPEELFTPEELGIIDTYYTTRDEAGVRELLDKAKRDEEAIPAVEAELANMRNGFARATWLFHQGRYTDIIRDQRNRQPAQGDGAGPAARTD